MRNTDLSYILSLVEKASVEYNVNSFESNEPDVFGAYGGIDYFNEAISYLSEAAYGLQEFNYSKNKGGTAYHTGKDEAPSGKEKISKLATDFLKKVKSLNLKDKFNGIVDKAKNSSAVKAVSKHKVLSASILAAVVAAIAGGLIISKKLSGKKLYDETERTVLNDPELSAIYNALEDSEKDAFIKELMKQSQQAADSVDNASNEKYRRDYPYFNSLHEFSYANNPGTATYNTVSNPFPSSASPKSGWGASFLKHFGKDGFLVQYYQQIRDKVAGFKIAEKTDAFTATSIRKFFFGSKTKTATTVLSAAFFAAVTLTLVKKYRTKKAVDYAINMIMADPELAAQYEALPEDERQKFILDFQGQVDSTVNAVSKEEATDVSYL